MARTREEKSVRRTRPRRHDGLPRRLRGDRRETSRHRERRRAFPGSHSRRATANRRLTNKELMNESDARREDLRKLTPLFLLGGLALFAAPIFHPDNTCKDWLVQPGHLSANERWVSLHQ